MEEWHMQGKPALILIHMQHAITDPEGTVAFLHAKATWESGIIAKQQALLKAFREKGLPVIYVNSVHPLDAAEKMSPYGRSTMSSARTAPTSRAQRTWRSLRR